MGLSIEQRLTQLEDLKKEVLEKIKSSDKTIEEKIKLICEHELLPIESWLAHPFREWENELEEKVKSTGKTYVITDSFIDPSEMDFDKYQTIEFDYILEILEDYDNYDNYDTDEDEENEIITVVRARGSNEVIKKTKSEVIGAIYNYMIKEGYRGYKVDW